MKGGKGQQKKPRLISRINEPECKIQEWRVKGHGKNDKQIQSKYKSAAVRTRCFQHLQNNVQGWRDSLSIKSTGCSYRGQWFNSQHTVTDCNSNSR